MRYALPRCFQKSLLPLNKLLTSHGETKERFLNHFEKSGKHNRHSLHVEGDLEVITKLLIVYVE
jgi:hypothetical protein